MIPTEAGRPLIAAMSPVDHHAVTSNGAGPLAAAAGAGPVMRADADRTEAVAPARAPGPDLEALRRDLIDEVMRRVRTDFERGG
jgi:hypothetical protein